MTNQPDPTEGAPRRKKTPSPAVKAPRTKSTTSDILPTRVVSEDTDAKAVLRSLRDGGATASSDELLFELGGTPLVLDRARLESARAQLTAADDPGLWVGLNTDLIRSIVFVPSMTRVTRSFPLLSVRPEPNVTKQHSWPVPRHIPGLHVVAGATRGGKSAWLAKQDIEIMVRWGEPAELYDLSDNVIPAADIAEALAIAWLLSVAGYRVAIDSLRNLVFGLKGAAGSGGVSVELYAALTTLNNITSNLGTVLAVALNPMSDGEKASLVYDNIAASVAGMSVIANSRVQSRTVRTLDGRISSEDEGSSGDTRSGVGVVTPRATALREPTISSARVRIDDSAIDPADDDMDHLVPRRGARLSI